MNSQEGITFKRILIGGLALAIAVSSAWAQDDNERAPKPHRTRTRHVVKAASATRRRLRAILAPVDFPITLTAYDRTTNDPDTTGTVLVVSKNGLASKVSALYTKDLEDAQISSVVSWQNAERTHFGFLVLTTPAEGDLYGVMFFLYHDGRLTMPIDAIATGSPVIPTIRKSDKSGQIQISFDEGSAEATNDQLKTVDIYTWSDWSHRFVKTVHQVAAESVERSRRTPHKVAGASAERARGKRIEKTQAAEGEGE